MQPKIPEEVKRTTEIPPVEIFSNQPLREKDADNKQRIEVIQRKIDDQNRIEQIRGQLGAENRDTQIESFVKGLPHKDGCIDFYQLQNLGGGGTHDVYIDPRNSAFVIKINRAVLEETIEVGQLELSQEARQQAEQYIDSENRRNEQLYQYFGREHCLRDQVIIQKIIVAYCGTPRNLEGIIIIQEASSTLKSPSKMSFCTEGYVERKLANQDRNAYDNMNNALLRDGEFDENDFLKLHENLKSIFELVGKEENFTESLREFLLRFKKYFETSGRFIDLVGKDNVVFFQQDGIWSFLLKSVLKNETRQKMEEALKTLEENPNLLNSDDELRNTLMNSLTLIRMLNATGLKTKVGKIIEVQLSKKQLENLDKVKF